MHSHRLTPHPDCISCVKRAGIELFLLGTAPGTGQQCSTHSRPSAQAFSPRCSSARLLSNAALDGAADGPDPDDAVRVPRVQRGAVR